MAEKYDFPSKVANILATHGVEATVSDLKMTGQSGLRIESGAFVEVISGVITRDKLAALAERIKAFG